MILRKKTRHLLEFYAVWLLAAFIRLLPARLAIRLGRFLGAVTGRLIKERMRLGHENLKRAFGDQLSHEERCRILRSLMELLGEALVESIIVMPEDVEIKERQINQLQDEAQSLTDKLDAANARLSELGEEPMIVSQMPRIMAAMLTENRDVQQINDTFGGLRRKIDRVETELTEGQIADINVIIK